MGGGGRTYVCSWGLKKQHVPEALGHLHAVQGEGRWPAGSLSPRGISLPDIIRALLLLYVPLAVAQMSV